MFGGLKGRGLALMKREGEVTSFGDVPNSYIIGSSGAIEDCQYDGYLRVRRKIYKITDSGMLILGLALLPDTKLNRSSLRRI